jgi:hypothetical protein
VSADRLTENRTGAFYYITQPFNLAFSVGGVIGRGEKIVDVVPDLDSLIIEAQINVDDISDVPSGNAGRRSPHRLQGPHHPGRSRQADAFVADRPSVNINVELVGIWHCMSCKRLLTI